MQHPGDQYAVNTNLDGNEIRQFETINFEIMDQFYTEYYFFLLQF